MQADQDATVATPDGRRTQANRDKRQTRKRKWQADREELARHRSSGTSQSKGAPSNKGKGKGKSKDQSGQEVCFSWASNKGSCADIPPGGECKAVVKRVHKSRLWLSLWLSPSHKDSECRAG